ncbi:hypothetical protein O7635_15955 [Asanoa sp. WMMD1127]|uniref:Wzz/FepE/Etk N-terminal domain-containing protein n=1 Tax=Asanoa sp. WMMD1127 TaxID=3016107 RepID=UPI0024162263|nr:Wzz/FepE/Etk N-terminal domain-containing protein [Asanoa sp. WMMD1127]MDG4823350.1 hypothetical protein [Asanoa sp. WMMD1127]
MDLLDLLKLVVRRWYVAVPIVILTLAAAVALGSAIQPEYKTAATVILVPPTTSAASPANGATPAPGNPWLRIGEAQMAQAVQIAVSSGEARQKVVAAGGDSAYEITLVTRSSIMTAEVSSESSAKALATVEAVTKLISDEVVAQQAKYKPKAGEEITTQVLDPGLNVTPSRSNVLRAQIVVLAIGLLLMAAAVVAYDAIARRRLTKQVNTRAGLRANATAGTASVEQRRPQPPAKAVGPLNRNVPARTSDAEPDEPAEATQIIRINSTPVTANGHSPSGTPQQVSADYVRAPETDDTILLTAVRTPRPDDDAQ